MKILLKNCNIITGKHNEMMFKGNILINNDIIEKVSSEEINTSVDKVIDLTNKYVLPSLINAHVHLPGSGKPSKKEHNKEFVDKIMKHSLTRSVVKSMCKSYAKMEVASGTTTIRLVGGLDHFDSQIRDELKDSGPRILSSDYAMTVDKGHMAGTVAKIGHNVEEFEEMFKDLKAHNVDLIKIMITGGVLDATKRGEPGELRMHDEDVKFITSLAHKAGLKVAAHVESSEGVRVALRNNVDTIEHGAKVDSEIIDLFKQNNASLVCTISPAAPMSFIDRNILHLSEEVQYNAKVVFDGIVDCAKACLENGITVGLGTDTACPFVTHYDMYRELLYAKKYLNVSALDAINMATEVNAKILGIDKLTGTIEENKSADLLILSNNPLDNLMYLSNLDKVMYKGKFVKNKVKKYKDIDKLLDTLM